MTKRLNSKFKASRRLGGSLWGSAKDAFNKKNFPPGQHGPLGFKKPSDYGTQLRAKQRLKFYYNITERQFRNIFDKAVKMKGDKGENFIGLLERRLDAIIYRLNFASTIFAARQLVSHKHIYVNGKVVNIPSYRVKAGDVIELTSKAKQFAVVQESVQKMDRAVPDYLEIDPKAFKGSFIRIPKLADVPYAAEMEPNLVIEFYSR